jgi:hypothetical protein
MAALPQVEQLSSFKKILFAGQRVTVERTQRSVTGYCVVGWESGLPVAARPITAQKIKALLKAYPNHTLI